MRRARVVAVVGVAVALLLSGCKADVTLEVRVDDDGSGSVEARFVLDEEAVDALGGNLGRAFRVADLIQAGWEVEVDDEIDGGGAEAVAVKRFGTSEQFAAVVEELSGDAGPFRDFRLTRERSFFSTDFEFVGTVDLEGGVGATALDPADEALVTELGEEDVEVAALGEFLSEHLADVFSVEVIVALPGDGSANAPGAAGGEPRWESEPGQVVELRAESSSLDLARIIWLVIGVLLLLLAAGVYTGRVALGRRGGDGDDHGDGDESADEPADHGGPEAAGLSSPPGR